MRIAIALIAIAVTGSPGRASAQFPIGNLDSEEVRRRTEVSAAFAACRREIERKTADALTVCGQARDLADRMPEVAAQRVSGWLLYAQALMSAERTEEAVAAAVRAVALSETSTDLSTNASASHLLGTAHYAAKQLVAADQAFEKAVSTWERAIEALPQLAEPYRQSMRASLRYRAVVKDDIGDAAMADALRAWATRLEPAPRIDARTVAGIRVIGDAAAHFQDRDLTDIRRLLGADSARVWIIETAAGPDHWTATVYLIPDSSDALARHGRVLTAVATLPAADAFPRRGPWQAAPASVYAHIPTVNRQVDSVESAHDINRPFEISGAPGMSLSREDILAITTLLRDAATAAERERAERPRAPFLNSEIQRWAIRSIFLTPTRIRVRLAGPPAPLDRGQVVTLTRDGAKWTIVEVSRTGS